MNWKTCFLPLLLAAAVLGSVTAFADGEPVTPPAVQNEAQTALAPRDTITTEENLTYTVNDDGQTVTLTNGRNATGSITIPATIEKDGTIYPVTSVENRAFIFCDTLTAVTFSGDVDSIGDSAFFCCTALNTVTFSGNIDSIRIGAFQDCDKLEKVTFSGDVDSIGDNAFWDCGALNTVTFSSSVDSIGDCAFQYCITLNTVTFFGGVDSIGSSAFESCTALENVTFSGNVGSIGEDVFWGCSALNTVTFSGDVGSIEDNAFQHCTALKMIYVPASMPKAKIEMIQAVLNSSGLQNVQIVQPEQPSDPDPDTPSAPSTGTPSTPSTGTTSTGSTVQQLEAAERPDPMDVEATERYNFWIDVKSDLRAAADGRTVRVYVPADYTNMPASVMETIRTLGKEITIDLRWNGQRLIITPQTALQRPARKAFWTFDALCEVYAR